jgi:SHS2 domain-containing protein
MAYEYLEDDVTADVTVSVWAYDVHALFHDAGDALTNAMITVLAAIEPRTRRSVSVTADSLDLLLLRFLEELIFYKDAERLLLRPSAVRVDTGATLAVRAELRGEVIDPTRHELLTDVKAVTLHGLRVERRDDLWHARVTLDV